MGSIENKQFQLGSRSSVLACVSIRTPCAICARKRGMPLRLNRSGGGAYQQYGGAGVLPSTIAWHGRRAAAYLALPSIVVDVLYFIGDGVKMLDCREWKGEGRHTERLRFGP